ncbi:hypothetical protein B0H67DRAFT_554569 [Lasiosphaeris hirsuta]|uniref:Uncharacterized protein n=1 Tax=Lasiosphaeris hirsuta TaxID=260670 RepID=A0AA40AI18_9PEZI|nr:hypothetical protein B0H67DRAFT_554569 [Lasiosphaeris hirsuta]
MTFLEPLPHFFRNYPPYPPSHSPSGPPRGVYIPGAAFQVPIPGAVARVPIRVPHGPAIPTTLTPLFGTTLSERILGIPYHGLSGFLTLPSFSFWNFTYGVAGLELGYVAISRALAVTLPFSSPLRRWLYIDPEGRFGGSLRARVVVFGTLMAMESLIKYSARWYHCHTPANLCSLPFFPVFSVNWVILVTGLSLLAFFKSEFDIIRRATMGARSSPLLPRLES